MNEVLPKLQRYCWRANGALYVMGAALPVRFGGNLMPATAFSRHAFTGFGKSPPALTPLGAPDFSIENVTGNVPFAGSDA
jgi:hypothetical protein